MFILKKDVDKFIQESNKRIEAYEKETERIRSMIPYEQMTMEDYMELFPDAPKLTGDNASFWPHTPEEQIQQKDLGKERQEKGKK